MRSVFFIPPLRKMSGGLAAIYELATLLDQAGFPIAVSCPQRDAQNNVAGFADFTKQNPNIHELAWADKLPLSANDLWCVPESWPNAIAAGHTGGAKTLVYVQNWAYMLNNLPTGINWKDLPLSFIAVGSPVVWMLQEFFGVPNLGVLPPAVNQCFWAEHTSAAYSKKNTDIRVAWMPRKNKALALQIQSLTNALLQTHGLGAVKFIAIDGMTLPEVAKALQTCSIYLSTGFPEGFGLPALEAMASGCVPVGFSGLGGFEYMRNHERSQLNWQLAPLRSVLYNPPCPLPAKAWGANGLYVADGDVSGCAIALAAATEMAQKNSPLWMELQNNARLTAQAYTEEARATTAKTLWPELIAHVKRL